MVINSQEILLLQEIQSVRLRVRRTSIEKTINFFWMNIKPSEMKLKFGSFHLRQTN